MKIAVLTEKPLMYRHIMPLLVEYHPEIDASATAVYYVNPFETLNGRFEYPRGLKWEDFPYHGPARFAPIDFDGVRSSYGWPDVTPSWVRGDENPNPVLVEVRSRFENADLVYCVPDPCGSSQLVCKQAIEQLYPDPGKRPEVRWVHLWDLTPSTARRQIADAFDYWVHPIDAPYALSRRRFDYCWDVNSRAIFGKAFEKMGRPPATVSKAGMQLLYLVRAKPGLKDGHLVSEMQEWKGSGKFGAGYRETGFGSPASRAYLIERFITDGLVDRNGGLSLTADGARFLEIIHPACEDPDIFFRIHAWCHLPEAEAAHHIDKYIRTYFGRAKRRLSKA